MEKKYFGKLPCGEAVNSYILRDNGFEAEIITLGAAIRRFICFGTDIIGGFDNIESYLEDTSHQGAIIGRIANRVENAEFTMNGVKYTLPKNDGENCLHGGVGFDYKIWTVTDYRENSITLEYTSMDGEEGFPSEVKTVVSYTLDNGALIIDYKAYPGGDTPISLTNHAYFNLNGFGKDIKNHTAVIFADTYTEVNENLIPTGNHPKVENTPFDFKSPRKIGERMNSSFEGYDHNFVISSNEFDIFNEKRLAKAVVICGDEIKMSVYTDQPGVQFYVGNFLGTGGPDFKGGIKQLKHGAFCLETQTEPNSVNHGIGFYNKGDVYTHTAVYKIERIKN